MNVKLTDAQLKYKNQLKPEYGRYYPIIDWVNEDTAKRLNMERKLLLAQLQPFVESGCNDTKPDVSRLSPGCRLCAAGQWSCLFINGTCNANCFYCPAPQNQEGLPQSNGLDFQSPQAYVAYVKNFGFKGVSLSGGEPLLSFDRSLAYLQAVKKEFGDKIHVWMYTNGILASKEKLQILRDAGLDEIRFDIGATNYKLKYLRSAIGIIPVVTVEIPAVPDEYDMLKNLTHELSDMGVNYLNLHQMRMTHHNMPQFVERSLPISHGKRPTVPESEITALKIMLHVKTSGIDLPVNYCSFAFKDRYQHAAARYRHAKFIKEDYEDVTENAYIRSMALQGDQMVINACVKTLRESRPGWEWYHEVHSDRLFLNLAALKCLRDTKKLTLWVGYHNTRIRKEHDLTYAARTIYLNNETRVHIERRPEGAEFPVNSRDISMFLALVSNGMKKNNLPEQKRESWYPLISHEFIESGLPDYY